MCGIDDYGPAVYDSRWVRARKEHACTVCGESIKPGHLYRRTDGLWDGHWGHFKHCARCWRMFRFLESWEGAGQVALDLDCGERYEAPPDDVGHLMAFMTPEEAQRYARRDQIRDEDYIPAKQDPLALKQQYYERYGYPIERKERLAREHAEWLERNRSWLESIGQAT